MKLNYRSQLWLSACLARKYPVFFFAALALAKCRFLPLRVDLDHSPGYGRIHTPNRKAALADPDFRRRKPDSHCPVYPILYILKSVRLHNLTLYYI